MENLFVSYEIAKQLKEKGFNEPCLGYYNDHLNSPKLRIRQTEGNQYFDQLYLAPIYQQVVDWFREKHNLHVDSYFDSFYNGYYMARVCKKDGIAHYSRIESKDYYKTLNKAIEEALKLI